MEPSDEALVLACRRGDADAWAELVGRYQRLIYSIPRQSGLDQEAASDVFQYVWTMLVEKLDSIEQPERLAGWLATTARRETWRISRGQRDVATATRDEDGDPLDDVQDGALLPDEQLLRLEAQHSVRAAVMRLDERCRTLLTLLFYAPEPPAYSEIAAVLGATEGSIGPTRARCLQKMRRLLDGD